VHHYLKQYGSKYGIVWVADTEKGTGQEWFRITSVDPSTEVEVILAKMQEVINEVIKVVMSGKLPRENNFALRSEQKECCSKIVDCFNSGSDRFLVAAKMRFGKTFTCYNACVGLEAKKVLILSYVTASKSSWRDDLMSHTSFIDCQFFDYKECERTAPDGTKVFERPALNASRMNVFFVSFQALHTDRAADLKKWHWIFDEEWDVVLIDEEHYGVKTPNAREVLGRVGSKQIHMSGTPFASKLLGRFSEKNTYNWDYNDEQNAKQSEAAAFVGDGYGSYQAMPNIHFLNLRVEATDADTRSYFSDAENPTLRKALSVEDNGNFRYAQAVRAITDQLQKLLERSDAISESRAQDHLLVVVPGVKEAAALEQFWQTHQFLSKYHIINATDDNVVNIDDAKKEIDNHPQTITLSCGRFTNAVTVPKWTIVVLLSDVKSPASYWQTCFRAQSVWMEEKTGRCLKKICYVIDFSLNRILTGLYEIALFTKPVGTPLEEHTKSWLRNAPIYRSTNGFEYSRVDFNEFFRLAVAARSCGGGIWGDGDSVNIDHPFTDEEREILNRLGDIPKIKAKLEKVIQETKVNSGKSFQQNGGTGKGESFLNETLVRAACAVERRLPEYMLASPSTERCWQDLIAPRSPADETVFEEIVGVTRAEFKMMVEGGLFDKEVLNDKIESFALREDAIELALTHLGDLS
jgi:hypothetical protein